MRLEKVINDLGQWISFTPLVWRLLLISRDNFPYLSRCRRPLLNENTFVTSRSIASYTLFDSHAKTFIAE